MSDPIPSEPPPSYSDATAQGSSRPTHLQPPQSSTHQVRNGIPPEYRRSMEDEGRPLPSGWLRQYDSQVHHQFFVDTNRNPPRSIWQHPYDDEEYMNSLSPQERARIQSLHKTPSRADIEAESSGDDEPHPSSTSPSTARPATTQTTQPANTAFDPKPSFGRKMKDKLTGTTHEQREAARRQRAIAEQQAYERHRKLREAMVKAMQTGQPQLLGKDRDGQDVYIQPPQQQQGFNNMVPPGRYGYNPWQGGGGPYGYPNAGYARPAYPYGRPYGRGYGGGYGLPLAGGLMGGLLLGDMIGGGF
ncbi:MAG: hypothetical protein HETSPECPRED_002157 [Heterodermia speciosa]|uniref:WW domain-containing protein n=1 Tax=Heterodermia speciosa TaxID=116794 RepID=A0A8H3J3M2_9LECA|nr:MAG: hypothetical protein HETSPECPRED_002157 [Heterodermia speciosa]